MMREFQEENERRKIIDENNSTSLETNESQEILLQTLINEQSQPSTPVQQRKNHSPEKKTNFDRNKLNNNTKTNKVQFDSNKVCRHSLLCFIRNPVLFFRLPDVWIILQMNPIAMIPISLVKQSMLHQYHPHLFY